MSRLLGAALDVLVAAGIIAGFFLVLDWALK